MSVSLIVTVKDDVHAATYGSIATARAQLVKFAASKGLDVSQADSIRKQFANKGIATGRITRGASLVGSWRII
jgi:uncharacterized lipoprotein YajG